MQWREPRQSVDLRNHLIGDPRRACEYIAAMHHAVADHRESRQIKLPGQPGKSLVQNRRQIAGISGDRARQGLILPFQADRKGSSRKSITPEASGRGPAISSA